MNGLTELRADVAGRVRARLDAAGRNEAVVLDVRDTHPPCVLIGVPTLAFADGQVTTPVSTISPGPGHADALDWLQASLEAIAGPGPLGPYRFLTADPVFVDVGDRQFPAYQIACSIPAPKTFCGNRLPGVPQPPLPRLTVTLVDQTDLTVTVDVTGDDPDAAPATVRWGDGAADTGTEHTYAAAGTYKITATQPGHQPAPPVTVTVTAPVIPQLVLTVTNKVDLTVTVDITNDDPTGPTASVVWGDSYETTDLTHTYDEAGTYTLFARQQGRTPSPPVDVTVTAPPPPPATGATAGTPGTFTPAGSTPPANFAALTALTAAPAAKWTTGQYVVCVNADEGYWDGDSWEHGRAPAPPVETIIIWIENDAGDTITTAPAWSTLHGRVKTTAPKPAYVERLLNGALNGNFVDDGPDPEDPTANLWSTSTYSGTLGPFTLGAVRSDTSATATATVTIT